MNGYNKTFLSREEIERIKIKPTYLRLFLYFMAVFLLTAVVTKFAIGADVTLQWDANQPTPSGYRLYQRDVNGTYDYSAPIWEGTETTHTVMGLSPGHTYYYVVRAYVDENESGDSNEVNFTGTIPPPANLRINIEISVHIDVNGNPAIIVGQVKDE